MINDAAKTIPLINQHIFIIGTSPDEDHIFRAIL